MAVRLVDPTFSVSPPPGVDTSNVDTIGVDVDPDTGEPCLIGVGPWSQSPGATFLVEPPRPSELQLALARDVVERPGMFKTAADVVESSSVELAPAAREQSNTGHECPDGPVLRVTIRLGRTIPVPGPPGVGDRQRTDTIYVEADPITGEPCSVGAGPYRVSLSAVDLD